MGVLNFKRRVAEEAFAPRDWSQAEIAEFYRAHNLLCQHGVGIGIDRGLTDRGEPWLVFFDQSSQDVFLHVARIDNSCILVSEPLGLKLWAAGVPELIVRFEQAVRGLVDQREETNRKVLLHPAAKMIMAVSAVFLLFKLDNPQPAYASDGHGAADFTRKYEASALNRVQSAVARLLEAADSPAALAAAASVLLATELLKHDPAALDTLVALVTGHQTHADTTLSLSHVAGGDGGFAPLPPAVHTGEIDVSPAALLLAAAIQAAPAITLPVAVAELAADSAAGTAVAAPVHVAAMASDWSPTFDVSVQRVAAPVAAVPAAAESQTTVAVASAADLAVPLSLAMLRSVLLDEAGKGLSFTVVDLDAAPATTVVAKVEVPVAPIADQPVTDTPADSAVAPAVQDSAPVQSGPHYIGDITVAMLPELSSEVGMFQEGHMSSAALQASLRQFMEGAVGFEIEYSGGNTMIEQAGLAGFDAHDIGIYRAVMNDGSTLSIVGHLGLLQDAHFLT